MKHTECKDCELRNGDCGYHFKMNGKTNYDIPSLSSCDRYGNCEFFQQKERPQGDLISREALKSDIDKFIGYLDEDMICRIKVVIDNAPTVEPERKRGKWIFDVEDTFKCSICNTRFCCGGNFCPCCGAKMWHRNVKGAEE